MQNGYDLNLESERVKNVKPSLIRTVLNRVDELRKMGHTVIALSAGEPDFNTPEDIKAATITALTNNHTHYCSNRGYEELRGKIAEKTALETGVSYDMQTEILVTSSGAEAINNVILSLIDEGDEGVIFSPGFVNYENMIKISGGTPVIIELNPKNNFEIDISQVEAKISDRTKLMVINNPNNPTGAVYSKEILQKLCDLAVKHNFLILSDEMYSNLVYEEGSFYSIASFEDMKERAIIVNGFSKTYAMTGWRLGYICASKNKIDSIIKIHQYSTTCSPTFLQIGLAKGMDTKRTKEEISGMIGEFFLRRKVLMEKLDEIKQLSYVVPKGAFYIMIDVSKTGLNGMEFAKKLLEEKYVAVIPGVGLGSNCEDYIRVSFAASLDNITISMQRIRELVEQMC